MGRESEQDPGFPKQIFAVLVNREASDLERDQAPVLAIERLNDARLAAEAKGCAARNGP